MTKSNYSTTSKIILTIQFLFREFCSENKILSLTLWGIWYSFKEGESPYHTHTNPILLKGEFPKSEKENFNYIQSHCLLEFVVFYLFIYFK